MAIRIPLVTDFDGKGLNRLKAEFKQLDGFAAKSKFILQKGLLPLAAGFAGIAVAGKKAIDAAIADQEAQVKLAKVLQSTTGATDAQVKAVEDYIDATQKAFAFTDDDLRPAFATLTRATRDTTKSQKYLNLAMDVAVGTGKNLNEVTDAFARALGSNTKSLAKLAPELRGLIKDGATTDEIFAKLGETFGGAASAQAETAAGRMKILQTRFSEIAEEIGFALLPIVERYLLPALEKFTTWLEDNPDKIQGFFNGIKDLSLGFYNFGKWVADIAEKVTRSIEYMVQSSIAALNMLLDGLDIIAGPVINFDPIPQIDFIGDPAKTSQLATGRRIGAMDDMIARMGRANYQGAQNRANALAQAGRTTPGLFRAPNGVGPVLPAPNVTVNVNGGDPNAVVDAIVRWSRQNGRLPPQVKTY